MAHSAQKNPLTLNLKVSTWGGEGQSESEFEILIWALEEYRDRLLGIVVRNRKSDLDLESETQELLKTIQTANGMITTLACELCLADQNRIDEPV